MGCTIIGCGKATPNLSVSNDDLAELVDTNDEWIVTRTGISSRRIAQTETGCDLAVQACRRALGWEEDVADSLPGANWAPAVIDADSIDLVICLTISPDDIIPSQACQIKHRLGLSNAIAFDANAACTGFIYGVSVAESMMAASQCGVAGAAGRMGVRRALIVGVERLSRLVDWTDRSTCILFGDGAGAAVLEWSDDKPGVRSLFLKNTDDVDGVLTCRNRLDLAPFPFGEEGKEPSRDIPFIAMEGQPVFKFAASSMTQAVLEVLDRANLTIDDVDRIIPHQANERIIRYAAKKLNVSMELFQVSMQETGNTSAASIPMALTDSYAEGRINPGDTVILVGFGGGLSSGAVLYQA